MNVKTIFKGEVQLLGWSDTHNGGAKLVLQLSDPADLEPFKHLTSRHGKIAGQILGAVIVVPDEAPEPVRSREPEPEKPKGGQLAQLAGMWCRSPVFQEWLQREHGDTWHLAAESFEEPDAYEVAHATVLKLCGIGSLTWLDAPSMDGERAEFHSEIRTPFSAYLTTRNATPS